MYYVCTTKYVHYLDIYILSQDEKQETKEGNKMASLLRKWYEDIYPLV